MVNIFWFRRDLRLDDNTGLDVALRAGLPVIPIFIFDKNILDQLEDKSDRRLVFINSALEALQHKFLAPGSTLEIYHGDPQVVITHILAKYQVQSVFANHEYEPYTRARDNRIRDLLASHNIKFLTYKDHVIFEKSEVVKDDGRPYTIFTPYSRKWKKMMAEIMPMSISFPSPLINETLISNYEQNRDLPSVNGTSRLSVHLRFGTISIRELVAKASVSEKFLNELIWREFYQAILWHFPFVVERSFKPAYDNIEWRNNEDEFLRWCTGQTGYPIVDAGMRELNSTGFMHNRVRMITASFLCKHLLIDWRWGEAYFASKLLDYELASNNGGWQWASGSGCDAAPYFRIFNPYLQTEKFDKERRYIRRWVPEFEDSVYPKPIVEHEVARKRCLEVYGKALKQRG